MTSVGVVGEVVVGLVVIFGGVMVTVRLLRPGTVFRAPMLDSPSWRRSATEQLAGLVRRGDGAAVLALDLDHLARVNRRYGREAGDVLVSDLGRVVVACAGRSACVARVTGGRMVVLLAARPDQAVSCAERIRQDLRCPSGGPDRPLRGRVTVSIGVALCPQDGRTLAELVVAAEVLLFAAKNGGRDQVRRSRIDTIPDAVAS